MMQRPIPSEVFLFDIDSVLVEPRGYRAAIRSTLQHFTRRLGLLDEILPAEDTIAHYEAHRITSEWDMVPLSLAAILDAVVAAQPDLELPDRLDRLESIHPSLKITAVDYHTPIQTLGPWIRPGQYPSEIALRLATQTPPQLYPHLNGHALLTGLFSDSRNVQQNPITRLFQHYSIGSRNFCLAYGLPPETETASLLQENDRPLLPLVQRDEILRRWSDETLAATAYTLRPSHPPKHVDPFGYSPEAEIALQIVGLDRLPRIGYGHMQYLALKTGSDLELFIKPSPVQAIAAIFAAITRREDWALDLAYTLYLRAAQSPRQPFPSFDGFEMKDLPPLRVHVFEDSAGGIEAVRTAGLMLNQNGFPCQVFAWGISTLPVKVQALEKIEAAVYPTLEAALQVALTANGSDPSRA